MRVLLRSDIDGVGRRGDVVDVSGARPNYSGTDRTSLEASPGIDAQAAAMRRSRDLRDAKDRGSASVVAEASPRKSVPVSARAGAEGRLFGSVTVRT